MWLVALLDADEHGAPRSVTGARIEETLSAKLQDDAVGAHLAQDQPFLDRITLGLAFAIDDDETRGRSAEKTCML
jgi:hypothetical protein